MWDDVGRILAAAAESRPDQALFCFYNSDGSLRERYSYASFLRRANYVGQCLRGSGVAVGEPVLLVYPPGTDMAVAFFACAVIGAIPVPAPPAAQARQRAGWARLAHIGVHADASKVLSTAGIVEGVAASRVRLDDEGPGDLFRHFRWIATDGMVGDLDDIPRGHSDVLFIQYTSGSTSKPRGVAVTQGNVIHNAGIAVDHDQPIGVSWLPHFHDMGLLGFFLFSVIKGGQSHCFAPVDFLRRPILWLELISRVRATITTAPNAAYDYCLRQDKVPEDKLRGVDLSSLRSMVNCAEPVRAGTFARFRRRFASHGLRSTAQIAGYGLAEHTLCVTTGGSREICHDGETGGRAAGSHRFISCGRPARDVDLRIVDADTHRPVIDGAAGEIWVDSPSKAAGYWRLPDAGVARFQARIAGSDSDRTYLRTGDIGFMDGGELFICGRLGDMLIVNGRNVFPSDIEAVLEERCAISLAGRVAAFGASAADGAGEGLIVLIEAGVDQPDLATLRSIVHQTSGVTVATIARVPRGTIVRTSSGKIARRLCRESWEAGGVETIEVLHATATGVAGNVEELVARLVAEAAASGNPNATLDQLGLDSIAFVDLSLALEGLLKEAGFDTPETIDKVADLSLLQALRACDLGDALTMFRSGSGGVAEVIALLDGVADKLRQDERKRMRADAAMPLPLPDVTAKIGAGVFLTGATGFLGGFLLRSLLELTDDAITVLVRGDDPSHGVARIRRALIDSDMPSSNVDRALRLRIKVMLGDLVQPRLGLSDSDWRFLADGVSRIYHCGAEVDYVKSYNLLRAANVLATREVITLAAEGCRKSLHYISTTFVFGWSVKPFLFESDDNGGMENLDFGYAQSKWVAEQLVLRAQRSGMSVVVYRPSLVTASAGGRFVRRDITSRVLGYMIRHGLTVDAPNQVSFLPVDICARNIVVLSRSDEPAPVFHMTADAYHTMADICAVISRRFGYSFVAVGLEDFVAHAHAHCQPDDDLYPLLSFYDRNTKRILRMGDKLYDSSVYRRARDSEALALSHPTIEATVEPIVVFLQREGLIASADRRLDERDVASAGALA